MYLVILDPYGQDDGSGDVSVLLQNPEQGLKQVQARQEKIKSKKKHTFCGNVRKVGMVDPVLQKARNAGIWNFSQFRYLQTILLYLLIESYNCKKMYYKCR